MLVEPCLRCVHRLIGELGLPFDVDALALRAVELLGQRLLQRVEFGELGIVPDRGDGAFDVGDRRLRAVLVDLLPCGVCELVGEFALSLQAVGLFLRARVRLRGLVALALRVLDARAQLRQIAFVDESDDLLTILDAMLAAFAGFDLPVGLHLPHGMVGVVDAVDATGRRDARNWSARAASRRTGNPRGSAASRTATPLRPSRRSHPCSRRRARSLLPRVRCRRTARCAAPWRAGRWRLPWLRIHAHGACRRGWSGPWIRMRRSWRGANAPDPRARP